MVKILKHSIRSNGNVAWYLTCAERKKGGKPRGVECAWIFHDLCVEVGAVGVGFFFLSPSTHREGQEERRWGGSSMSVVVVHLSAYSVHRTVRSRPIRERERLWGPYVPEEKKPFLG